jgi:hypothetical protein
MLIGLSPELAAQLTQLRPPHVDVVVAGRPGEAMRRFDAESPDMVILGVGAEPDQAALLLQALRDRPLGALVPVALVDSGRAPHHPLTTPAGAAEAGADRYFSAAAPAAMVLRSVGELLGVPIPLPGLPAEEGRRAPVSLDLSLAPAEPQSQDEVPTRRVRNPGSLDQGREDFPPPPQPHYDPWDPNPRAAPYQPPALRTPSPDAYSPRAAPPSRHLPEPEVNAEVIRLKLRQVRHEDYFSILDLRKGAEVHVIEQSHQLLRRRFEPSRLHPSIADRYHNELREICEALDDAFAVLRDDLARDAYLRAVLRGQSA